MLCSHLSHLVTTQTRFLYRSKPCYVCHLHQQ
nr:MAG TPA: cytochrome c protein [Bacteriophage sp.]DAP90039.1 MAG TPA: cytochrome c protein [Caudoviricetes sp.]DAV37701.1 MAG TPA: cytochrome c protein [Bacteriophage sp.]